MHPEQRLYLLPRMSPQDADRGDFWIPSASDGSAGLQTRDLEEEKVAHFILEGAVHMEVC